MEWDSSTSGKYDNWEDASKRIPEVQQKLEACHEGYETMRQEVEAIRSTYCVEHGGSPGSEKDCVRCLKAALELAKTALETCGEWLGKEDAEPIDFEELHSEWIKHPLDVIEQALKGEA